MGMSDLQATSTHITFHPNTTIKKEPLLQSWSNTQFLSSNNIHNKYQWKVLAYTKEVFLTIQHVNPIDFDQNQQASTNGSKKNPHENCTVRVATLHVARRHAGERQPTIMRLAVACRKCLAEALKNSRISSKSSPDLPASGQSPTE